MNPSYTELSESVQEPASDQLHLFKEAVTAEVVSAEKDSFSDPAFGSNKLLPVHRWVPWVAGYSSDFVRSVLERYLPHPGVVLDPFAGVGTTLVEAEMMGHEALGFEINPYAALASRVKVEAVRLDADALALTVKSLRSFYEGKVSNGYVPESAPPPGFRTRVGFYSPAVLRKVLIVQDFIEHQTDPLIRDAVQLAFAATMVRYSNYSYEPSLSTRQGAGKSDIKDADVLSPIIEKLQQMVADVRWLQAQDVSPGNGKVIAASFFECQDHMDDGSADVLITSPPYVNNYHYIRNTRPHLYWLGFVNKPKDTKAMEHANFGKYWQTVRDGDPVHLEMNLPESELPDKLNQLRALHPEKGVYGGAGWANYVATYFNDCRRFAEATRYALRPGGRAFIVVGNSILQGIDFRVDRYLGEIAEATGLELVEISIPRETRVGNSIISSDVRVTKAKKGHALYEAVVHLRRPE